MLKTTNHLLKRTNDLMPVAYACITKIKTHGLNGVATLSIQKSREECQLVREGKLEAKHEVIITFTVDYNKHLPEVIYEIAKGTHQEPVFDDEKQEMIIKEVPNYFNGWDNDIV